tara:strand:- start:931 stop:1368 length:438 start_codon:yes stop_codon:yes gene_type:complete
MYKGISGGILTRVLTGNLDDYKAELRRQQLTVEQEEYQQQVIIESLVESVSVLESNSNSKQTEVNFGEEYFSESLYITIIDNKTVSTSIIQCSMSISNDRDADELEFTDFVCNPYNIRSGVGYSVLVKDISKQATGKYLLNTTRN